MPVLQLAVSLAKLHPVKRRNRRTLLSEAYSLELRIMTESFQVGRAEVSCRLEYSGAVQQRWHLANVECQ